MKKVLIVFMCMTILAGCTQNGTNDTNQNTPTNDTTDTNNNNTNDTNDWFDKFETGLKENNIHYSAKTSLDATTIGGAEGYRYTTENGHIDIYRFEDGDDFDRIVSEKQLNLNGQNTKVEVNDHLIIVSDGVSDDVLNVFRGLK